VTTAGDISLWGYVVESTDAASGTVLVPDDVTPPAPGRWYLQTVTASEVPDDSLTLAKLEFGLPETGSTAVALDHADSSPKTLLAANANVDRIVRVRGVATEAAAGGPDFDVGSATTDPNGVVDDFKAGAWKVGDQFDGVILLPAGEALVATITTAGTAGACDVFIDAIVVPKPVALLQAGQNETSTPNIAVAGIAAGDELVEFLVYDTALGTFTQRALSDFTVGAAQITVVANDADNSTAKQYHIRWIDKT